MSQWCVLPLGPVHSVFKVSNQVKDGFQQFPIILLLGWLLQLHTKPMAYGHMSRSLYIEYSNFQQNILGPCLRSP